MSVVTKESNPELYNALFPEDEIKEILDTLDDLSKRPTTELAMRLMETTVDNITKDKELDKYKNIVDKTNRWLEEMLKQAKSEETKAIINGTLDLLLKGE